jgi:hypothetical protein
VDAQEIDFTHFLHAVRPRGTTIILMRSTQNNRIFEKYLPTPHTDVGGDPGNETEQLPRPSGTNTNVPLPVVVRRSQGPEIKALQSTNERSDMPVSISKAHHNKNSGA